MNTKDNINIRCRLNTSEEHSWHTSHSQLNLVVDLLYNFYITWGKRQDELDLKLERLYKDYKRLEEQYSLVNNNINLVLKLLEESKLAHNRISQNSDYIKEDTSLIHKKLESLLIQIPFIRDKTVAEDFKGTNLEISNIKELIQEVKTLVLS